MCGIVGILRFDGASADEAEIAAMTAAVAHRGPDGEGTMVDGGVALGHRRLAIIDRQGGAQPMADASGRLWLTYNGEIYNYRQLRAELSALGHVFRTQSDTEVLLGAYAQWGAGCLDRLRGMFAFGIVDLDRRRFLLARDPLGIKPLVFRRNHRYLAFASELNALLEVRAAAPTGDLTAVESFLRFQYVPAPATIYHEIEKLPPACYLAGDLDGRVDAPRRYWSLPNPEALELASAEWSERVDRTLADSVAAHLVADVPVGLLLSGGVDSIVVAAVAREVSAEPLQAFTIGLDDPALDELPQARVAAEALGLEHRHAVQADDFWPQLGDLIYAYGEPFADNSAVPTWRLARLARERVPVVLSGDGGDEAFAGYWSYGAWLERPGLRASFAELRRAPSRAALRRLAWSAARKWWREQLCDRPAWQRLVAHTNAPLRRGLWRAEHRWLVDGPAAAYAEAHGAAPKHHLLAYAQAMDFHTYLPGAVLTKVDVASMFHGLEVRTPLCDREVVEMALSIPVDRRYRGDGAASFTGKLLLRDKLARQLPAELAGAPKRGFGIPRPRWLAPGRPGYDFLREVISDPASRLHELFERRALETLVAEQAAGRDRSATLWLVGVLGLWLARHPRLVWR